MNPQDYFYSQDDVRSDLAVGASDDAVVNALVTHGGLDRDAAMELVAHIKAEPVAHIAASTPELLSGIPDIFKAYNNWVTFESAEKKAPIVSGKFTFAKSDDPNTWVSFDTLTNNIQAGNGYPNIGFVPDGARSGYLTALDIDNSRNGAIMPWASKIIDFLGETYSEVTVSGTGLRAWVIIERDLHMEFILNDSAKANPTSEKGAQIEVVNDKQYMTLSRNALPQSVNSVRVLGASEADGLFSLLAEIQTEFPVTKVSDGVDCHPNSGSKIPYGQHDKELHRIAGKLRGTIGLEEEAIYNALVEIIQNRCENYGSDYLEMARKHAHNICQKPVNPDTDLILNQTMDPKLAEAQAAIAKVEEQIPIVDDPRDSDTRFDMPDGRFDTGVYERLAERFTAYPDPGVEDLVSEIAHKIISGTTIDLAFVREPLKLMVGHAINGWVMHPAYPDLSLRGYHANLGPSFIGKTKGLDWALQAGTPILGLAQTSITNLFRCKSEQALVRSLSFEGSQRRDKNGAVKDGTPGNPKQFLILKEGNLIASSDSFAPIFSRLTDLYDQSVADTESITNSNFAASGIEFSCAVCFTLEDFWKTFGNKGNIGSGGLGRFSLSNPPKNYNADDWVRLPLGDIQIVQTALFQRVFQIRNGEAKVLKEEPGAKAIRLEVTNMLKGVGQIGVRLIEYFVREQVIQAATAKENPLVMTTKQAEYAKTWVEAQLQVRADCWPPDAENKVEIMEHTIRKAVDGHFIPESVLKNMCHVYRPGTGGNWAFAAALKNGLAAGDIKWTAKTRKAGKAYCPASCNAHEAIKESKPDKK